MCLVLTPLQVPTLPSGLLAFGLSPIFSKEECVQTVRSFSYAWQVDLTLSALPLTPFERSYIVNAALPHAVEQHSYAHSHRMCLTVSRVVTTSNVIASSAVC